ncbi:cobyrinate a,c-diamide synthase [Nocardia pseudobrasiliensis]|uniref:Hydrogenobyrinate a,c-diamide synthase n=1 Tax=Nocardia pseudobrasiliensis TaxID=45979 RepID=A0A370I2M8_9NOCA|nr:cobyrinate a,c-diamide synthase [Nocardia pseudobrasiliensis]RDI64997.1 hydrogenobyrinic acid a,c-diamide synthase (glutamine-hydrolysing) /cobyrinate a,c-diamide synthase [Nocardia pseudobrasiliensis]
MNSPPAVVIAAPASGSGKTTLATGLIGALRAAGHRVAPYKVGPDYIDPGYHGLAAGRPGRNLDPVLVGTDRVVPLYRHGGRGCDIAVVEGVMGLFDGRIDENHAAPVAEGSTAQVAALLGAPVVLVVDARGHSQSLAALLHGFATFDSGIRLGGVILNRVGSPRHEEVLRAACARVGLPVLGALPRMAELVVPSRHLGLIPAVEHGSAAQDAVEAMTALVAAHVDLDAVVRLAAVNVSGAAWDPVEAIGVDESIVRQDVSTSDPVIAIAGGPAFTFGYAEHRELLEATGARVAVFDPLHDELPLGTAGLVLPGGFPEEHAADLAANTPLLSSIAESAHNGMPIHAECAGLLYLTRSLDGHRMSGVLDATAEFGPRLTLGYRDAVALTDSALWPTGSRVRGHEFHRTRLTEAGTAAAAWGWRAPTGEAVREGAMVHRVHASYLHTHPAGNAGMVQRFVSAAREFDDSRVDG